MENNSLKRKSLQGAAISAIGFFIVIIAFIYSSSSLKNMNERILEKSEELSRIESQILKQDSVITAKEEVLKEKNDLIDTLVKEINKLTDSNIRPRARAVRIPGLKDSEGRDIYDFTVWVNTSQFTINRISKISYDFMHDTFILRSRESDDVTNGFLVSYRGWGCLTLVRINIQYNDGRAETLFFNMCEALSN